MNKIKNTLLVSALSLGLIVGAAGMISAATSSDFQQKAAISLEHAKTAVKMNAESHTAVNTDAKQNSAGMDINVAQNSKIKTSVSNTQQPKSGQPAPQQPGQEPYSQQPSLQNQTAIHLQNVQIPVNANTDGNVQAQLGGNLVSGQWSLNLGR